MLFYFIFSLPVTEDCREKTVQTVHVRSSRIEESPVVISRQGQECFRFPGSFEEDPALLPRDDFVIGA